MTDPAGAPTPRDGTTLRNVILFGASGFIGAAIEGALREAAIGEVTGHSSGSCDLASFDDACRALRGSDRRTTIVMCAAAGVHPSGRSSLSTLTRNLIMAQNLLRALPPGGIRSLVYVSSVDVYGKNGHVRPIHERTALAPEDYYGFTKVICEQVFLAATDLCGPTSVLRLPGIYGPTDAGRSVVGTFVRRAMAGKEIEIHGDGMSTRDFVAVADVANVVLHFVREPTHTCVNVTKGTSHSVTELASIVADSGFDGGR